MTESQGAFVGEPADNQGFARINWRGPLSKGPVLMFVPASSDAANDIAEAFKTLGAQVAVWQQAERDLGVRSKRAAGLKQLASGGGGPGWVGVLPFHAALVREAEKCFPTARVILVADDPVVLWVGGEDATRDLRTAIVDTGRTLADLSYYAASTARPTMMISARKAKEFPESILRAFGEFADIAFDDAALSSARAILGRPQAVTAFAPVKAAIGRDDVRGGLDMVHKSGIVTGWAKKAMSAERVPLRITVNGREVARAVADEIREDLARMHVGDGHHGFRVDVSSHLNTEIARVEVIASETDTVIGAADLTLARGLRVMPGAPLTTVAAE